MIDHIYICVYSEMITTVKLSNTSMSSYSYLLFLRVRAPEIYSLSKFPYY